MVWIVYIFRHLCKVDAQYGTLKWYIQLSRLNNMSLLRRTVVFFFFIQVFVLVVCFIIAGSMRAASNCDAGGNDCLDDEEDKETYLERVAKLFNKEFIFEQFLCFFVLFDLYDVIDEENALLNLESSAVGNLKCSWINGYLPNGPNEIKELIEDSALHILLFNKYNLKGDQNKCSVDLKKLLGVDGANKFAQEVLMVAREAYKERPGEMRRGAKHLNCHHNFHPPTPFCNLICFSQKMRRLTSWAWGAKGEEWTRGWSLLRLA